MGWIQNLFKRRVDVKYTITGKNNPYQARKKWPPDFEKLPFTQQFNFEKRYRRRSKLKYQNENWIRGVKITQWTGSVGEVSASTVSSSQLIVPAIGVYAFLIHDWQTPEGFDDEPPFWTLRHWIFGEYAAIWTTPPATYSAQSRKDQAATASE
ncbi:uncharacterized protein KY384_004493 [Bacidia gigantensis]|uniref:uncharacterized protein n=1 Tax=Bacidia gigantensis TaxID=2732470 RepID=UPI001D039089|nr:uncharacterized protein KY384_004493 [Bacidia gigantensis]KAG8531135.1 hypothetical protein KY384_004493 [Bacidia gigantensis]